jgi:hypothetical protein
VLVAVAALAGFSQVLLGRLERHHHLPAAVGCLDCPDDSRLRHLADRRVPPHLAGFRSADKAESSAARAFLRLVVAPAVCRRPVVCHRLEVKEVFLRLAVELADVLPADRAFHPAVVGRVGALPVVAAGNKVDDSPDNIRAVFRASKDSRSKCGCASKSRRRPNACPSRSPSRNSYCSSSLQPRCPHQTQ